MPKPKPIQLHQLLADVNGDPPTAEDLAAIEPMPASPGLRDRLMASIAESDPVSAFAERISRFFKLDLETARQHLSHLKNITTPQWESARQPGAWLLHFDGGSGLEAADCGLIYMESGSKAPRHRHLGDEWMLVIQGEGLTGDGETLLPGDVLHSPTGSCHEFTVVGDQPLAFAVIAFTGIDWHPAT